VGSLAAALAVLASALGGGTYEGRVDATCDRTCVALLVTADDGRSLMSRSIVAAPCDPAGTTSGFSDPAPRGTPVHADGSFRWRNRFQVVEGHFSADGRTVSGTSRFLGLARGDCSSATTTFSARLTHRAKPNGTCEPLSTGPLDIAVFVRATGCTKATRVVDAWQADRDCLTRSCRVAGRRCTPVDGGRLRNLAGVACRAGRSEIELVIRKQCGLLNFRNVLATINASCTTARFVGRAWLRQSCGRSCTAAGWRCRLLAPRSLGPGTWRCRRVHRAIEIRQPEPVES
jgi:hypothetical protein